MLITGYCTVNPQVLWLHGSIVFEDQSHDTALFLKSCYRNLNLQYPKFFKMDNLSKLGFIAVEYLLKESNLPEIYLPEEIGIVLQNGSSSLESDEKHQESISNRQDYFPSPSVFVYTLPNIMAGEIAIRHKIKGENAILISQNPDADQLFDYVNELFSMGRVKCCVTGWVEAYHENWSACLLLVETNEMAKSFNQDREMIIFDRLNLERILKEASQHARIDGKA